MKKFNTAGPSMAEDHFMIDPLVRIDIEDIESLIADKRYFVLHAPRQTGKTTCLLALMQHLNAQGKYRALYVNIEAAQAARGNVAEGMAAIVRALASAASVYWGDETASDTARQMLSTTGPTDWVRSVLEQWSRSSPRPIVLLLDEVDAPLDDANTERYAKLVTSMSAKGTQFLFISHNKIAMEMAEQLIGVTMQEQGVSRIVAVDMASATHIIEST